MVGDDNFMVYGGNLMVDIILSEQLVNDVHDEVRTFIAINDSRCCKLRGNVHFQEFAY